MRTVIDGNYNDSTSATAAYLASHNQLRIANLYLIGEYEDPQAQWLTDWPEGGLIWPPWGSPFTTPQGLFSSARVKRGQVATKIGLEVTSLDVEWTPNVSAITQSLATASPYQLAQLGHYDNMKLRAWSVYMPTPGDCMTYGASELFGGRIAETTIERGNIKFHVNSFLDVINEKIPTNVVEMTNTLAGYKGATPPTGMSQIPQFNVITGSTDTNLILDATSPTAHQIFTTNQLRGGFLVFNAGVGATLGRFWSAVAENQMFTIGIVHYNQVILYTPLPWAPTPGVDTCFISAPFPINLQDGNYFGFPYVPAPEQSL